MQYAQIPQKIMEIMILAEDQQVAENRDIIKILREKAWLRDH